MVTGLPRNSILAATARSAQWTSGMCLLREMQSTGLVPTIISFGTGLSFGRGARWRQGFRLLQQLWRISLQLNTVAANAAISCVSPGMSMSGNEEMLPRGWSAAIHMYLYPPWEVVFAYIKPKRILRMFFFYQLRF